MAPSTTQPLIALGPSGGYQAMGAVWYEGSNPFEDVPATISAFHEPDQELLWSTILPDGSVEASNLSLLGATKHALSYPRIQ